MGNVVLYIIIRQKKGGGEEEKMLSVRLTDSDLPYK